MGRPNKSREVPIDEVRPSRFRPVRLGEFEITTDGDRPRNVDNILELVEETHWKVSYASLGQLVMELECLGSGDGHPLSIDGIETRHSVTDNHEIVRKFVEVFN